MKNGRNIIFLIMVIVIIILGLVSLLKKDVYIGFYYPDANNLINDIQSDTTFDSLEICRDWVNKQVSIYNQNNSTDHDYECGKNCDLSGGKPYVCEETLK